jgi:pyridoxamine 5'-phosphate oxidase
MQPPLFYDDLDLSFSKAWDLIELGAANRTSPAHTPVVATINETGQPETRVMVLREANRLARRLRFHTDSRSAKLAQVRRNPTAAVIMYDPQEKLQIRLSGHLSFDIGSEEVNVAWRGSTTFARRCYMAVAAPGEVTAKPTSGLPAWIESKQPTEEQLVEARANFVILWFEVQALEWLYLANPGHRRAKWTWDLASDVWSGSWLVP